MEAKLVGEYVRRDGDMPPIRVVVLMSPDDVSAIDTWGVPARMKSRGAAVRALIKKGLAATSQDSGKAATGAEFGDDTPAAAENEKLPCKAASLVTTESEFRND